MKKTFTILLVVFASIQLFAQMQFNPQIGLSVMSFSNPPDGYKYHGKAGMSLGADLRFGGKFQLQPGVHYISSKTGMETNAGETTTSDVTYKSIKLKALLAYNLIDADQFKFRVNAGPSYDFLLAAKNKDSDTDIKDNFNNGTFFLQGGVGVDFLFLTADVGYAQGLSKAFNKDYVTTDAKSKGFYFTVGVVFGKGK
jgi:hypothetical protein